MRQNAFAVRAPPRSPLGDLRALPPDFWEGECGRGMERAEDGKGTEGEGKEGREREKRKWNGVQGFGEVNGEEKLKG